MSFQEHMWIQQEATRKRELIDAALEVREARRVIEGKLATPKEQKDEKILRTYRPSTVDEALTRARDRMAEREYEEGIAVGSEPVLRGLEPRTNPDRWLHGDPDDMEAYSRTFGEEQRAERERREREDSTPEAIRVEEEIARYRELLEQLEQANQNVRLSA